MEEALAKKYCEGKTVKSVELNPSELVITFTDNVVLVVSPLCSSNLDVKVGRYEFVELQD